MKIIGMATGIGLILALAGCSNDAVMFPNFSADGGAVTVQHTSGPLVSEPVTITSVTVTVPSTLTVSEANSYFPRADIVWREDLAGDRHEQVRKIVATAADRAVAGMTHGRPVILDIQVMRFHAITEKAEFTIGGTHDLRYYLALRDARTGAGLGMPHLFKTEFRAPGGQEAVVAKSLGYTQKEAITGELAKAIKEALTYRGQGAK